MQAASSPRRRAAPQWADSLLFLQFILIPILYIVQELTVRLGAVTWQGDARPDQAAFRSRLGVAVGRGPCSSPASAHF